MRPLNNSGSIECDPRKAGRLPFRLRRIRKCDPTTFDNCGVRRLSLLRARLPDGLNYKTNKRSIKTVLTTAEGSLSRKEGHPAAKVADYPAGLQTTQINQAAA